MKRNLDEQTTNSIETATANNVLAFTTTLRDLKRTVDPQLIRQRAGHRDRNGHTHMVEYVEWHTVADILDEYAPNWAHTVKDIRPIGDIITVTVAITIDGITREGVGTGKIASETGIKKAEHDALKRAAVKFGIARELYKKEFDLVENDEVVSVPGSRSYDSPVAATLGDMVSGKQLGMIRAIGREAEIDVEQECARKFNCQVEELSKRAASDLISHLQTMQQGHGDVTPMRRAG